MRAQVLRLCSWTWSQCIDKVKASTVCWCSALGTKTTQVKYLSGCYYKIVTKMSFFVASSAMNKSEPADQHDCPCP